MTRIPWYVRQPQLLASEIEDLRRRFPSFTRCESPGEGDLAFHGSLERLSEAGSERLFVVLRYPDGYPYAPPAVAPYAISDVGEPHPASALGEPLLLSARHQMRDGYLCLFERAGTRGTAVHISGVDALRRAEEWYRAARRGRFPSHLDSLEVELEEHYERSGDIVLGPEAFRSDLPKQGRFIAVACRPEVDANPLYALTHLETATGATDERATLARLVAAWTGGQIGEGWWTFDARTGFARADQSFALNGTFVTLDGEPAPVRGVEKLAELISPGPDPLRAFAEQHRLALSRAAALIAAVRFPSRMGGDWEWLFFRVKLREKSLPSERVAGVGPGFVLDLSDQSATLRAATLTVLKVQDLRRRSLQLRNHGRVPVGIDATSAVVAGAGALGSSAVDLLAKAGLKRVSVWDLDFLDAGNVLRHTVGIQHIGIPKALLVAGAANSHNIHCDLRPVLRNVLSAGGADDVFGADIVLSTIADDATELELNLRAVEAGKTVYYLRALRRGAVGRLVRVRPHTDACLQCLELYAADGSMPALDVAAAPDEVVRRECGSPVLAASAADLAVVTGIGVRMLLSDLAGSEPTNYWLWTTTGVDGHPRLSGPLSSLIERVPPHPRCTVCQAHPVDKVVLPMGVRDRLVELSRSARPSETGGIVVGCRDDRTIRVTAISDAGPNAVSSPARFERDGPAAQAFLEEAVGQRPGVTYLGEWHSHPKNDATPSPTDVESLHEISCDADYRTPVPILLIVGFPSAEIVPVICASVFPEDTNGYLLPVTMTEEGPDGVSLTTEKP